MNAITEWRLARRRVAALVSGLSGAQLRTPMPSTPDWTARDLLSHMVGVGADVIGGDEPDDHNSSWTQAQVEARADRSVPELLEEWRTVAGPLVAWMQEHGSRPLNDVVIHEQDLRGGVGVPGGRESGGLGIVRERMVARFADAVAALPAIALAGEQWSWCSSGATEDAAVLVRASDFDLFRALTSRRTADQLRAWTERGDVTAYLDAFAGLGPLPASPLSE